MSRSLHAVDGRAFPAFRNGGKPQLEIPGVTITDLSLFVGVDAPRPSIRVDGVPLLYPGLLHDVHGEAGSGKTWLALFITAQMLASGGNVVLLDYESSPPMLIDRMRRLGVPDEALFDQQRFARVESPSLLDRHAVQRLSNLTTELRPSLVVMDSVSAALALDGVDENDNGSVRRVYEHVRQASRDLTVLVLDHVTTKNPEHAERGGRGASAKRDAVDVSLHLTSGERFSPDRDGHARLRIRKDRPGFLGAFGDHVADLVVRHGDEPWVRMTPPTVSVAPEVDDTDDLAMMILALLAERGPLSRQAVRDGVRKRKQRVVDTIDMLIGVDRVTEIDGLVSLP